MKKSLLLGTSALMAATMVMPVALAQDTDIEEDDREVIVVTAGKREQTLQEVPIAVSVVSGEVIEQARVLDLIDLQTLVPSLRVTQLQNSAATNS